MRYLAFFFLSTLLAGCGGSNSSTAPSSNNPPVTPAPDPLPVPDPDPEPQPEPAPQPGVIVVTRSGSQIVAATISAGSQEVIVTFSAQDERSIDTLIVTEGLGSLPDGWTGPASFACSTITMNNGCSLTLTYAPTAIAQDTLTLQYQYDSAGADPVSAEIEIAFEATSNNNVVTTVTPVGQVLGVVASGHQSVRATFTSDDGNPINNFVLTTDLAALPAGWSSESPSFACASVSTGSGCQLVLEYEPLVYGDGTLALAYSYTDNAGSTKNGTLDIPYVARVHNSVVATPSQAMPFNVAIGQSEALTLTFTTDDGHPMRWVEVVTDLANDLPADWSANRTEMRCEHVSTGNGCQLVLEYSPTSAANSSFMLQFGWEDGAGRTDNASIPISFNALTHNSVLGTPDPSGQVAVVIGGSQDVHVTFATDDSLIAHDFALDTDLSSLPAGWSAAASSLLCESVHSGGTCALDLTYAPNARESGTLTLSFSYTNNAGTARNGTLTIPYVGTTDNNIVVTADPEAPYIRKQSRNLPFTLTFTSDDGAPITGFTTTTALNSIPSVSSGGQTSKVCATVSTGSTCTLDLTFIPGSTRSGTIAINYSYVNNAGLSKAGTVNLPYESWPSLVYLASEDQGVIHRCEANRFTGDLSSCSSTGATSASPMSIAFDPGYLNSDWIYIANYDQSRIERCTRHPNGALSDCTTVQTITNPTALVHYTDALLVVSGGTLRRCPVADDGSVEACVTPTGVPANITGLTLYGNAWGITVSDSLNRVSWCSYGGSANHFDCVTVMTGLSTPRGVAHPYAAIYVVEQGTSRVRACRWNDSDYPPVTDFCESNDIGFTNLRGIALVGFDNALINAGNKIIACDIEGYYKTTLTNCRESGPTDVGTVFSIQEN